MKKKRSSNYSLPEDLVVEILSLVSIKTLLRFKCVCKSWYDLIPTLNIPSKRRLIVVQRMPWDVFDDYFIFSSDKTDDLMLGDLRFDDFDYQDGTSCRQHLLGSYNGVVCLADEYRQKVTLWNPATRQFKCVPWEDGAHVFREHVFGYDFKTNDYKVMRFDTMSQTPTYEYKIAVYSFKTGLWRDSHAVIPDGLYLGNSCYDRPRICVDGFYSTMVYTYVEETSFLFTLDMSNDVFILTPMPPEVVIYQPNHRWILEQVLTEINKSVAFITRTPEQAFSVSESFEIFVLNEYGPNGMWTKLYTVEPLSMSVILSFPLGFWRDALLLRRGLVELVLCDPITLKSEIYRISNGNCQVLEYKESLAWINENR